MLSLTYSLKLVLSSFADCKEQDIIFYVMLCESARCFRLHHVSSLQLHSWKVENVMVVSCNVLYNVASQRRED